MLFAKGNPNSPFIWPHDYPHSRSRPWTGDFGPALEHIQAAYTLKPSDGLKAQTSVYKGALLQTSTFHPSPPLYLRTNSTAPACYLETPRPLVIQVMPREPWRPSKRPLPPRQSPTQCYSKGWSWPAPRSATSSRLWTTLSNSSKYLLCTYSTTGSPWCASWTGTSPTSGRATIRWHTCTRARTRTYNHSLTQTHAHTLNTHTQLRGPVRARRAPRIDLRQ